MTVSKPRSVLLATVAFTIAIGLGGIAARAATVTSADLHAVANALGFLNGLPQSDPVHVGIIFGADRKQAGAVAGMLKSITGPNQAPFRPTLLPASGLANVSTRFDVLLIMPDAMNHSTEIARFAKQGKTVTVATDPACIGNGSCVLMVQADHGIRIVLNTELAEKVGADFSPVFAMMVERQ